jgi:transposase
MEKPAVWVGVDVSKEQLEVALRPSGEQFSLSNDARALRILVKRLLPLKCARIVVEATGGYETLVVAALQAAALPIVLLVLRRWSKLPSWPIEAVLERGAVHPINTSPGN